MLGQMTGRVTGLNYALFQNSMTKRSIFIATSMPFSGDPAKAQDFHLRGEIEPAKLEQIGQADLLGYVNGVKQYHFQGRHLTQVQYIDLD